MRTTVALTLLILSAVPASAVCYGSLDCRIEDLEREQRDREWQRFNDNLTRQNQEQANRLIGQQRENAATAVGALFNLLGAAASASQNRQRIDRHKLAFCVDLLASDYPRALAPTAQECIDTYGLK